MKQILIICLALVGVSRLSNGMTIDDAAYTGIYPSLSEPGEILDVKFASATYIFTLDAVALAEAADKYNGQTLLMSGMSSGYESGDQHMSYYTMAWAIEFDADTLRFLPGYISSGSFKSVGNTGYSVSAIAESEVVCLTIRGLTKDGGGSVGVRYAFEAQIANNGFMNYLNWRNNTEEDFAPIAIESLTVNPEFVSSYYLFDDVVTSADRKTLVAEATAVAPKLVPEPSAAALSLATLIGLLVHRRRKIA